MKRIASTLLIVTLTGASAAATAAEMPFPSGGRDGYNQTQIFPNMPTYQSQHRDAEAAAAARPSTLPPSADQQPGVAGAQPLARPGDDGAVGATR